MFGRRQSGNVGRLKQGQLSLRANGIPIKLRGLSPRDWQQHAAHLQRLTPEDRRSRFHSGMSDSAIEHYVRHIDWQRALIFGVFVRGKLRAVGELIPSRRGDEGEISVSVERAYQHAGIGRLLVLAMVLAARNIGLKAVRMIFFRDNDGMRALARNVGARSELSAGVMESVMTIPPRVDHARPAA